MLGIFGGENWTPSLDHTGTIKTAQGVNHWAIFRWDANAKSNGFERQLRATRNDQFRPGALRHAARRSLLVERKRDESYGVGLAELMNPEVARHPQPVYSMLQATDPVFRLDGVGVIVASWRGGRGGAQTPRRFSSGATARRPQGEATVDPVADRPARSSGVSGAARPIVAPPWMKLLETSTTGLVNDLSTVSWTGEIDFSVCFSTPFPSQVFLTLFGLPLDELPGFLKMKDGVIRPDQGVGHEFGHPETEAYQQQAADSIYAYFEDVIDERGGTATTFWPFLGVEVDGDRLWHEEILDICFLFLIAASTR